MARGALNWSTIQIPFFGAGLNTKQDPRFSSPPSLDIARDVQFELLGGLQTRPPFAAMSNSIQGGGTLTNCRRIDVVNGELVVFTDVALFSWNAQLQVWVNRGTHLAVKVDETSRCVTTGDQIDGDRAELSGTVVFAWTEGTQVYAEALDKVTGSVLVSPTAVSTAVGRARLVALSTKILLFVDNGSSGVNVRAIDPASPAAGISGAGTLVAAFNGRYDVVRVAATDTCAGATNRSPTTSYVVFTVTAGLVINSILKARTCDGPIAVAVDPTAANIQVVRGNGTAIQGDLVAVSNLADVFTNQAIGTATVSLNQVTAEFSTVQVGGFYVCSVFWSRAESATGDDGSALYNTVTTNNAVGSAITLVQHLGLASRAFAAQGHVFVWLVFARQNEVTGFSGATAAGVRAALQNTYFLYREDGLLVAKALPAIAGGHAPSTGRLPAVITTSGTGLDFAWCATGRRLIDLGGGDGHTGYAERDNVEVSFSFDTTQARRAAVLGQTLYVADGLLQQYDGTALYEVGFLVYPYQFFLTTGGGGSIVAGTYVYKGTFRWPNAQGEAERSTTAFGAQITAPGGTRNAIQVAPLTVTKKSSARIAPSAEVWRTAAAPATDAPFYLASGIDPTALAGSGNDNGYIPNDVNALALPSTGSAIFNDNFTDATLTTKETNPENGGDLENLAAPAAKIIIATDTRLFLAGVAGDPHRIWPSKLRNDGEIAAFNDALPVEVPHAGGDITAIWFQDEVLYVGRQYAIYALPGVGFDNAGGGQNFGPARIVSPDVGPVSQEAQALTPIGTIFKSAKGWQLLDRGGQVRYVGGPVSTFDGDTVLAMHVMASRHQVRVLTNNRVLLWDYRGAVDATTQEGIGNWAEWTIADGVHATIWNGTYVYLTATGPKMEQAAYSGLTYGIDAESSWIKPADLQGFAKLGYIEILGEYRSACLVRVRVARDYQYDGAGNVVYFDDKAWSPSPTVVGSALQVRHSPSRSQGEAFKVRITAVTEAVRATLLTTALSPQVTTSGTAWAATWQAAAAYPGVMGNALAMSLAFEDSGTAAFSIDVRDHFTWNHAVQRWIESIGTVGVRVLCRTGSSPTVAQLEAGIAAGSALVTLAAADATPAKVVSAAGMLNLTATAALSGGTYGSPTGEAIRLTGIGLECGIEPGLNRRLPAAQKQ